MEDIWITHTTTVNDEPQWYTVYHCPTCCCQRTHHSKDGKIFFCDECKHSIDMYVVREEKKVSNKADTISKTSYFLIKLYIF